MIYDCESVLHKNEMLGSIDLGMAILCMNVA